MVKPGKTVTKLAVVVWTFPNVPDLLGCIVYSTQKHMLCSTNSAKRGKTMANKPVLMTGIQASGDLHLGSYLGTMAQWKDYTQAYQCFYFIADLHVLTVRHDPRLLYEKTLDMLALFQAMDFNLDEHTIFVQSQVPQHAELAWVLSCITGTGELNRMTQFKDKTTKGQVSSLGLYAYPCLMASDILLYQAKKVPVGEDQKQHLELTRDLAIRFNKHFGSVFTIPDPIIPSISARVMALQDPTKKMSKSDDNKHNSIFLLDDPDVVRKKIKRAVTDSQNSIAHDASRPGISNLVEIYAALSGVSNDTVVAEFGSRGYAPFKQALADLIISHLEPIQAKYTAIREDGAALKNTMRIGSERAQKVAQGTLERAYDALGLVRV